MTTQTTGAAELPKALPDFEVRKLAAIGAVSTSSGLVERRPIEYRRELETQFVRGFRAAENRLHARVEALSAAQAVAGGEPVHQFRKQYCADWYDGYADHSDGGGPYEERTLYIAPPVQAVVPAGWNLVPTEPTQAMLDAVVTSMDDFLLGKEAEKQYREDWAAMLAAAPAQPVAEQGAAYAATPTSNYAGRVYEEGFLIGTCPLYTADQLRAFADATYALRATHGQAPAPEESVTAPGGGVVAAGRFMDEAAERRSAQEGYENRIKRVSERNPHDEGMYSLGWWDRAWKAAAPTPAAQAADSVQEDALSDSVRTPLDSLHADAAYLIGRLRDGSMPYVRVIEIIRERIDAAKAAIRARAARAPADSVQEDAARYRWLRNQPFDEWKRIAWHVSGHSPTIYADRDAAIDAACKQGEKQ